jgi:predicted ATPase
MQEPYVTVVGEAGVGKSTLAHFIAEAMPSHEAGGCTRRYP